LVDAGLSSRFAKNQTIAGSYTFESTTPAVTGSTSVVSQFNALTALSFDLGGYIGGMPGGTGVPAIVLNDGIGGHDGRSSMMTPGRWSATP
jgi:hypothetical protein